MHDGLEYDESFVSSVNMQNADRSAASTLLSCTVGEERQILNAWDLPTPQNLMITKADRPFEVNNKETKSSLVRRSDRKETHQKSRSHAQRELLGFAKRAMTLYGGRAKGGDPPGTETEKEHFKEATSKSKSKHATPVIGSKAQAADPKTSKSVPQESRWKPTETNAKRSTQGDTPVPKPAEPHQQQGPVSLGTFSLVLKSKGVEVLKFGRRNKWQVRYLTVSKEVVWVSYKDSGSAQVGQCPKGLLWLKTKVDNRSHSLSTHLGRHGRGGFLFKNLNRIEVVKKGRTSAAIAMEGIPRKVRSVFPEFIGVSLDYSFEDVDGAVSHRSVMLNFKTKQEADAFVSAMQIIKVVVSREQPVPAAMTKRM